MKTNFDIALETPLDRVCTLHDARMRAAMKYAIAESSFAVAAARERCLGCTCTDDDKHLRDALQSAILARVIES